MQTSDAPGADASNHEFCFDNPERSVLRRQMMAAIIDGTPFTVLSGPAGAGKSALISRLIATLPDTTIVIFISQVLGDCRRFEDVLLRLCQGIEPTTSWESHPNAEQILHIQEKIRQYLAKNGLKLLLVLDQAEQAFLAMLERVRKMLDTMNGGALCMQLVLVGQETLLTDLERLRLVHFQEIEERYFTLPLLDEEDEPDFLRQWLRYVGTGITADAVSPRVWKALRTEAAGRPGALAALLAERIDTLSAKKIGQVFRAADPAKPSFLQNAQKNIAGLSLSNLSRKLRDTLPGPPTLPRFRLKRPTSQAISVNRASSGSAKRPITTPHAVRRRAASLRRLRRKNAIFWGKLNRCFQQMARGLARGFAAILHGLATAFRGLGAGFAGLGRLIGQALAAILHGLATAFRGLGAGFVGLGRLIGQALTAILHGLATAFRGLGAGFVGLGRLIGQACAAILHGLAAVFRGLGAGFAGFGRLIGQALTAILHGLATIFRGLGAGFVGLGRFIGQACAAILHGFTHIGTASRGGVGGVSQTARRARLPRTPKTTAPPSRFLKRTVISCAALALVAGVATALWQGLWQFPQGDQRRENTPVVTAIPEPQKEQSEQAPAPQTEANDEATENVAQLDGTNEATTLTEPPHGPIPSTVVEIPMPTAPPEPAERLVTKPRPEPEAPPEVVKITADKFKKEIEPPPPPPAPPEPVRPIRIARAVVVEKIKPQPVIAKLESERIKTVKVAPRDQAAPMKTVAAPKEQQVTAPAPAPPKKEKEKRGETPVAKTEQASKAAKVEKPESADRVYNAGLSAGQRWVGGKNNGKYTVQILTTSAKDAQTLVSSLPAQHAGRLTIVPAGSGRVTLFYGDYPSMTEARQARGSLPAALRRGNPYAISVDGAMGRINAR
ncbi:MAG: AAA family ATPase [Desulfobulbaceae bacterium]|jgi:type II secretory pathway predicted ATPase ExeA|nr:AAA family ATPase [Desulfobulbaceae bacterium]